MSEKVTKDFCDERLARQKAELKTEIQPIKATLRRIESQMDKFGEDIAQRTIDASNGEITVKRTVKEKWAFRGVLITTVGLVAVQLLELLEAAL